MRARDACEQLIKATLPFAEKMLREHGEFCPFAAQMLPDGKIVSVSIADAAGDDWSDNLIEYLQAAAKACAEDGSVIATALIYDARVAPPGRLQKSDAIVFKLDHRDSYSVVRFFPYTLTDDVLEIGTSFMTSGDYAIFPAPNPLYA